MRKKFGEGMKVEQRRGTEEKKRREKKSSVMPITATNNSTSIPTSGESLKAH